MVADDLSLMTDISRGRNLICRGVELEERGLVNDDGKPSQRQGPGPQIELSALMNQVGQR